MYYRLVLQETLLPLQRQTCRNFGRESLITDIDSPLRSNTDPHCMACVWGRTFFANMGGGRGQNCFQTWLQWQSIMHHMMTASTGCFHSRRLMCKATMPMSSVWPRPTSVACGILASGSNANRAPMDKQTSQPTKKKRRKEHLSCVQHIWTPPAPKMH